mmetsp:Transcript_20034/g.41919  ORF Transcript_20034/g.41919 Transcript_20034/m.41919 type:complete len:312 (-) Transcript_20034:45-980(-)
MSLNIYGQDNISDDDDSDLEGSDFDEDFADYLETSILSQKEEEGTSSCSTTMIASNATSISPPPCDDHKSVFSFLPDELKFFIITLFLPPPTNKAISKAFLKKLQQPQRQKIVSRLAFKLSDSKIDVQPRATFPSKANLPTFEIAQTSSSSPSFPPTIPPLPLSYVVKLEEQIFNRVGGQLLMKPYHTAVRKIITAFSLVRSSNGHDGPRHLFEKCLRNQISEQQLVQGIIENTITFANPNRASLIEAINEQRRAEVTLTSSRTAPPAMAYNEPCENCGGMLYYSFKIRKEQLDRGRVVVHCNSCSFLTEL